MLEGGPVANPFLADLGQDRQHRRGRRRSVADGGACLADPFFPSAALVALLRAHASRERSYPWAAAAPTSTGLRSRLTPPRSWLSIGTPAGGRT
jgi:hypothetical protein